MAAIEFRDVARLLTCEQFARSELPMRSNRAKCPVCDRPDHYNLAFLRDGKAYCHKCHFVGDVVTLAAKTWHTSQMDAAHALNREFHLGLEDEAVNAEELERRRRDRERARDLQMLRRRAEAAEWSAACDAELAARAAIERFTEADAETPAFELALKRLAAAQMQCELLEAERAEA